MRFASRTNFDRENSTYAQALLEARSRGDLLDLTVSNPTQCGFLYAAERLLPSLGDPRILTYDADPLGMRSAREAISHLYRDAYAADVHPDRLLLTASTSEAYSYLLRLFCEPGDAILVPSPSYPLFDLLARLHDVELIPYPLVYHDGWQIDPASLTVVVTPRTRAIVAIHPNNPTGHYCSPADREALYGVAAQHDLPLIVDEVFLDYAMEAEDVQRRQAITRGCPTFAKLRWDRSSDADRAEHVWSVHNESDAFSHFKDAKPPLTFVLGGLSKLLALPQMKVAWIAVCGPDPKADAAMERLEVIADTFLSVSKPPQMALPSWLGEREGIQQQITTRVRENLRSLDDAIAGTSISRLRVEGGWAVVVRIPAIDSDHDAVIRLLGESGLAVHPGSFYGFPERGWLVLSLLPPAGDFQEGVRRLARTEFGTAFPHIPVGS